MEKVVPVTCMGTSTSAGLGRHDMRGRWCMLHSGEGAGLEVESTVDMLDVLSA
jgi:hypothetical protein